MWRGLIKYLESKLFWLFSPSLLNWFFYDCKCSRNWSNFFNFAFLLSENFGKNYEWPDQVMSLPTKLPSILQKFAFKKKCTETQKGKPSILPFFLQFSMGVFSLRIYFKYNFDFFLKYFLRILLFCLLESFVRGRWGWFVGLRPIVRLWNLGL